MFWFTPLLFIFETLNDMAFVVKVIVFSYMLFWLYMTFREAQLLFGVTAIIASYFILFHAISTTMLLILFFIFVVFGMQLQMVLQFGLLPLLGYHFHGSYQKIENPQQMAELQQKAAAGEKLTPQEMQAMQQSRMMDSTGASQRARM